jgi:hypothetical protein
MHEQTLSRWMRGSEPDARARNASFRRPGPGHSGQSSLQGPKAVKILLADGVAVRV